ncbi:uncharacterized protein LOC127250446 [Andrographis paniculata]|uniref:uncharacterized protein LOC127250446 n=1 Tax=Andrographis paniculata TaxID=175694 RepID=UPI0021E8F537|nr:uncharacterized protein LOC127250446 [Andrographis paniculata]
MKISAKLQDHHHQSHRETPPSPVLIRAKIPLTIFNLPFLSHFSTTTTHPSDLSLSLSTNFSSGPSLKFSYTTAASASCAAAAPPFSLTLKSGTGVFGSPTNSPLVISAHFSFAQPNPTFSLLVKPQFGSFSLRKSIDSHADSAVSDDADAGGDSTSYGFVPVEIAAAPKDKLGHEIENPNSAAQKNKLGQKFEVSNSNSNSVFKGIRMAAATQLPVAKSVSVNFRWWVNFSGDQMPVLRINKIGIRRAIAEAATDSEKKEIVERNSEEFEFDQLKGLCFWMKRELDGLTRVNKEMKEELEEMKSAGKKAMIMGSGERPSGFEQWRSRRKAGADDNGNGKMNYGVKEEKDAAAMDVENELQRAIMAATAAAS